VLFGANGGGEIARCTWFPSELPGKPSSASYAALRRQRGADYRLVRVHVGDGRDADAWRLDDVNGDHPAQVLELIE
jgi:hypothetical protein